jgi:hypothetical protein
MIKLHEMSQDKRIALANACRSYNYKWPKELSSGVMFYDGERITIQEFNAWARQFK